MLQVRQIDELAGHSPSTICILPAPSSLVEFLVPPNGCNKVFQSVVFLAVGQTKPRERKTQTHLLTTSSWPVELFLGYPSVRDCAMLFDVVTEKICTNNILEMISFDNSTIPLLSSTIHHHQELNNFTIGKLMDKYWDSNALTCRPSKFPCHHGPTGLNLCTMKPQSYRKVVPPSYKLGYKPCKYRYVYIYNYICHK